MSSLYDIQGELLQLYELATEDGDEQAFLDTLESIKGELSIKAAGYVQIIKQLEMEIAECDRAAQAFTDKLVVREHSVKRMKDALISAMDTAGIDTLKAGNYELKIVNNGGVTPLNITGEVPDSFTKVVVEPDKTKIRKALEAGEELNFAELGQRGRHLKIK